MDQALRAAGANYHAWSEAGLNEGDAVGDGEVLIRLVLSFATEEADVRRFLDVAGAAVRAQAAE